MPGQLVETSPTLTLLASMSNIVELNHDELVDEELDEILDRLDRLESAIVLLADRMDEIKYLS
ncbi:MAG: hypothetical protein PVJ14_08695, partial [Chromatiales bacterium]